MAIGSRTPATLSAVMRALFSLVNLKLEEIHFAVGEALADVIQGRSTGAQDVPAAAATAAAGSNPAALSATAAEALSTPIPTMTAATPAPVSGATPLPRPAGSPAPISGSNIVLEASADNPAFSFELSPDNAAATASAAPAIAAAPMDVDSQPASSTPVRCRGGV